MKQKSEGLVNNEDIYQLKVGNMIVEFKYSENDKEINECLVNVLKQKNLADAFYETSYTI